MPSESTKSAPSIKRRKVDVGTKIEILLNYNNGMRGIESLARKSNVSDSTVKNIIEDSLKYPYRPRQPKVLVNRQSAISEMENMLSIWIEDRIQRDLPITAKDTKAKAKSIYDHIKWFYSAIPVPFVATDDWLEKYRKRAGCRNLKLMGKTILDRVGNTKQFLANLRKIIDEEKYLRQQVFNVDMVPLFWRNMPEVANKEVRDRITLVLGCNATGDCKLKPLMVYNTDKPHGVENIPVHYQSNARSWLTAQMFEEWFLRDFVTETRHYCQLKGIPFKILLFLEMTPRLGTRLIGLHPDVKVVFMPNSISGRIKPIDQDIMSIFKAYYVTHTLSMAVQSTEDGRDIKFHDFCESYTICKAALNIKQAWDAIPETHIPLAWKLICVLDIPWQHKNSLYQKVKEQIILTAARLGLKITKQGVDSLLQLSVNLTNDDLIELAKMMDDEEKNGQIDLTDDQTTIDDYCMNLIEDHAAVDADQSCLILYSPEPSTSNEEYSKDLPIDYIKIEEPQLMEPSLLNAVPVAILDVKEEGIDSHSDNSQHSAIIEKPLGNQSDAILKITKNPLEPPPRVIAREIELAFDNITCGMEKFESVDSNNARFQAVCSAVNDMLSCYKEMFEKAVNATITTDEGCAKVNDSNMLHEP